MSDFRVVSYNVRYFGHGTRGLLSTASAFHGITGALSALDPPADIVCLQEVETASIRSNFLHPRSHAAETQLDRLLAALDLAMRRVGRNDVYDGHYFPAHDYRIPGARSSFYTTGLAILVRRPLRLSRHNAHQPFDITHRGRRVRTHAGDAKPWLKQTRICAHAAFEHPSGATIDLFNTHLSLPAFSSAEFWTKPERMGHGPNQLEEARELARFVDAERTSDRFLVVGDFNSLPGSPVYGFLTDKFGLADPLQGKLGDLESLRRFPTAGFMHLRMHLDHILSGPGIRWRDLEGTRPFGDRESPFHGLSDHSPLIGRFTI